MQVKNEERATYDVRPVPESYHMTEDEVIAHAMLILTERLEKSGDIMSSPDVVRRYITLKYAQLGHEEFGCVWLDARNRVIAHGTMFRGTLTQTSVYHREVVKEGLKTNAAAVILFHNHPSGSPEPSSADEMLTRNLKTALEMVDIYVLDHIIVAGVQTMSFAERGLL